MAKRSTPKTTPPKDKTRRDRFGRSDRPTRLTDEEYATCMEAVAASGEAYFAAWSRRVLLAEAKRILNGGHETAESTD